MILSNILYNSLFVLEDAEEMFKNIQAVFILATLLNYYTYIFLYQGNICRQSAIFEIWFTNIRYCDIEISFGNIILV